MFQGNRDERETVDVSMAKQDAQVRPNLHVLLIYFLYVVVPVLTARSQGRVLQTHHL